MPPTRPSPIRPDQVLTACNRDCPDACGVVATVKDGRVVRLQGDPSHPVTQGFLCERTSRFLERQYDPDRVTTPLLRDGDAFHAITWDEALDRIAESMLRIRRESGGAGILHYRCGGSLGLMKHVSDYFFERFGPVTIKSGDICSGAGEAAQVADFGDNDSHDLFDLHNSKTIVLWGKNVYVSSVHLIPILRKARKRGTRIILIDPVWHRSTELADTYLQPRPGGDIALALGIARILFDTGRLDTEAADYCDHFDEFQQMVRRCSTAEWARQADLRVTDLEDLADAYAQRPVATLVGWGMQRRVRGAATVRVLDALGAVSGNLGIAGGGVSFYFQRRRAFDLSFSRGVAVAPRAIPEPLLARGILEARDPPIRMAWITAANPVAMLPDSRTMAKALKSRELTVVVDSFLTDTARCAHLVLPTTTMLEDDDLLGAYGHHWLAEVRPVVPPPEGVKTDYEIVRALAPRLGLDGDLTDSVETWKRRMLGGVEQQGASLEELRAGAVRSPLAVEVLHQDRKFKTATGRFNLIHALPDEPSALADKSLLLMSLSTEKAQASQWIAGAEPRQAVATVHPDAAQEFEDGQTVIVASELGRLRVTLRLDARQRRDVLLIAKGGWLRRGQCANALIPGMLSDDGGCAALYDTPVQLLPDGALPSDDIPDDELLVRDSHND